MEQHESLTSGSLGADRDLFAIPFPNHDYWATGVVFCLAMATDWFDGRIARRAGSTSSFGSLLDPVADKLLVMTTLIVLIDQGVPGVDGRCDRLRAGSSSRACGRPRSNTASRSPPGDLGKLKTVRSRPAAPGDRREASPRPARRRDDLFVVDALAMSLALTWISGIDYAHAAPLISAAPGRSIVRIARIKR